MIKYNLKIFEIAGRQMQFNSALFDKHFMVYAREHKIGLGALAVEMASQIGVTDEAIRNWRRRINGPSSLDKIYDLEAFLGVKEGGLLMEVQGENDMNELNDRQITAVKKIYDCFVEFLDEFQNTDGFNTICLDYQDKGVDDPVSSTYDYVEKRLRPVYLCLDKEFFDLRQTELYNELCEFASSDLVDIYNDKISFTYRNEAAIEGEGITTNDDYCDAMAKLNSIIEKYI